MASSQEECTIAFNGLENVEESLCVGSDFDAGRGGYQYNVTFVKWPRQVGWSVGERVLVPVLTCPTTHTRRHTNLEVENRWV